MKNTEGVAVLAKLETTYNTLVVPSTSTDQVQIIKPRPDLALSNLFDGARTVQNGGFGQIQRAAPSGRQVKFTIRCELKGNGAAYTSSSVLIPNVHTLFRICGMTATVTTTGGSEKWTLTNDTLSVTPASATMYVYTREELFIIGGVYASFKIIVDGPGIPVVEFTCVGTCVTTVADTALPAITYHDQTVIPPSAVNIAFTWGTFTGAVVRSFTFDQNRSIDNPRANINGASAIAAHAGFAPGVRAPSLQAKIESTAIATSATAIDPYTLSSAGTSALAFTSVFGGTQYDRWKLQLNTGAQLMEPPTLVDEAPIALWDLKLQPYVSTQQGINDFQIVVD